MLPNGSHICLLLAFFLFSCTITDKRTEAPAAAANPYQPFFSMIREGQTLVKDGDLILRDGQEFSSQVIKNFNRRDKSFSHAGLVFYKNGHPLVYHIVPGDENPDRKLRTDSLKDFCHPRRNFGFALYRYHIDAAETARLKQTIEAWHQRGIAFDSAFNLKTDERMYCSEMIQKGLAKATRNRIVIATTQPTAAEAQFFATHLRLPLSYTTNLDVVSIDNLFMNPHCRVIKRFDFK